MGRLSHHGHWVTFSWPGCRWLAFGFCLQKATTERVFHLFLLKHIVTLWMYPRLVSSLRSSCFRLQNAEITSICHQPGQQGDFWQAYLYFKDSFSSKRVSMILFLKKSLSTHYQNIGTNTRTTGWGLWPFYEEQMVSWDSHRLNWGSLRTFKERTSLMIQRDLPGLRSYSSIEKPRTCSHTRGEKNVWLWEVLVFNEHPRKES